MGDKAVPFALAMNTEFSFGSCNKTPSSLCFSRGRLSGPGQDLVARLEKLPKSAHIQHSQGYDAVRGRRRRRRRRIYPFSMIL